MSENRAKTEKNGPERRFSGGKVELRDENGKKHIVGTGILYFDGTERTEFVLWDDKYGRAVERIMPGAARSALSRDDIRGLFNHDSNLVLGRNKSGTMTMREDAKGVHYDIEAADTAVSRDVQTHLSRGDVSGSSFSFTIPSGGQKWTMTEEKDGRINEVREISEVELFDMGPVTFPAYENTTAGLREARSAERVRNEKTANEKIGISHDHAKSIRLMELETECAT